MASFIKDINLSSLTAKIQPESFGLIRNNADLSRAVNLVAGIIDSDYLSNGKLTKKDKTPTELKYPIDIVANKEHDTYMKFSAVEERHQTPSGKDKDGTEVKSVLSPQTTILLYNPGQLAISYEKRWAQEELGVAGGINTQGGVMEAIKSGVSQLVGRGEDSIARSASSGTGLNLSGALEHTRQSVVNPNLKLLFKGINMRTFQFSFMFSPRSEAEVLQSLAIVKSFKYYSAPWIEGPFHHYPALFNIQLMKRPATGGAVENLFKYKKAACTSVTVDYAPNSIWATFKDGTPVSFRMDLSFTETDVVTRKDIAPRNETEVGA